MKMRTKMKRDIAIFSEWYYVVGAIWRSYRVCPTGEAVHPGGHPHARTYHTPCLQGERASACKTVATTDENTTTDRCREHFIFPNKQTFASSNPRRRSWLGISMGPSMDVHLWTYLWTWTYGHHHTRTGTTPRYFFGSIDSTLIPNTLRQISTVSITGNSHLWT